MEMQKPKLTYRKYDAISVEGPVEAKNGKQYYQALFEENADENGGYTSQSKGYVKNFFEDTHSLIFLRCQKNADAEEKDKGKFPVKITAAKETVEVNPYYLYDKEGKPLMSLVNPKERAVGNHISIFLMPDENADAELRRRTRNLEWVPMEDVEETEEKEKEATK